MITVDWDIELAEHRLFGDFDKAERDQLLDPSISTEVRYQPGKTILREGEVGKSLYLIGSGEVEVCVSREDGHRIPIYTLAKADIFGEMALFENKPRSASIIAQKECVLLELDGEAFLEILRVHPDVEFKILSNLSDRLRRLTNEVLVVKFNDLNQKFDLLDQKVNSELNLVRNSITTAESMLTTANQRVQEITERARDVVESTNQSHNRIFQAIKIVGLVGGVAVIALGALGFQTWTDVDEKRGEIQAAVDKAVTLNTAIAEIGPVLEEVETWRQLELKFYKSIIVERVFLEELFAGDLEGATKTFGALLNYPNDQITEDTFNTILNNITAHKTRRDLIKRLLVKNLNKRHGFSYKEVFLMYYFLLSAYVIDGEPQYDEFLGDLKKYAKQYPGGSIKETFTADFTPQNFQDYFKQFAENKAVMKLSKVMEANPDKNFDAELSDIYEDKEIDARAYKMTEKIRDVWDIIP